MAIRFPALSVHFGPFKNHLETVHQDMAQAGTIQRIWRRDHTLWSKDPASIADRLGWLDCPYKMGAAGDELERFTRDIRQAGFGRALLLGMGGSSLAADVFRLSFGVKPGYLDLTVVDTTDPETIAGLTQQLDFEKTLFVVATKSGSTVETLSLQKHFYHHATKILGSGAAGDHFVAITDPGSGLADMAAQSGFRHVFLNDPDIGGRYSALSFFGLVPAALLGVDIGRLIDRAASMADHTRKPSAGPNDVNSAAALGAAMAEMSKIGRDKLTLFISKPLAAFGPWIEQLVAESTGKKGKGILPVIGSPLISPKDVVSRHTDDRLFVFLRLDDDPAFDTPIDDLKQKGVPLIQIDLKDIYDLGGEFFRWEIATALAGALLGINPFDQPNVEAAKVSTNSLIAAYRQNGALPEQAPAFESGGIRVYGTEKYSDPAEALKTFVTTHMTAASAPKRSYVAIQAYLKETADINSLLNRLSAMIGQKFKMAVTVGYGPRFLHSTGQLHKGDAGQGLFVQLTADSQTDLPIPATDDKDGAPVSFGVLFKAQASGDYNAIRDAGRHIIRFHLGADPSKNLQQLVESFCST